MTSIIKRFLSIAITATVFFTATRPALAEDATEATALLDVVPIEYDIVGRVDVANVLKQSKIADQIPGWEQVKRLPLTVDEVVFAANSFSGDGMLVVRSRFDYKQAAKLRNAAGPSFVEGDFTYYKLSNGSVLTLVGPHLVIAQSTAVLRVASETYAGQHPSVLINKKFAVLLHSASGDVWMAAAIPNLDFLGTSIDGVVASLDLSNGLLLHTRISVPNRFAAWGLAAAISTGAAYAAADSTIQRLGLAGLVSNLSASASGKQVDISVQITEAEVQALVAAAAAL